MRLLKGNKRYYEVALITVVFTLLFNFVLAETVDKKIDKKQGILYPKLPKFFKITDFPGDSGKAFIAEWIRSVDDPLYSGKGKGEGDLKEYIIYVSESAEGPYRPVGIYTPTSSLREYFEKKIVLDNTNDYAKRYFKMEVVDFENNRTISEYIETYTKPQFVNTNRGNIFCGLVIYVGIVLVFTYLAKRKDLFIRKIAGLDAIDEAVGRATEMGKPVLYVTGLSTISSISTIASINILSEVAKKIAKYETPLIIPNCDPIVMIVEREVVREAYAETGKSDAYKEDNIFFLSDRQFAYAAGVDGIMLRERPAANFFLGYFYAESLILAETGASTGAIQIAGTDAMTQLPFFISACDYTLIGEELYAASAYLSKNALLLGTLKAQDFGKFCLMIILFIGIILTTLYVNGWITFDFSSLFEVFE